MAIKVEPFDGLSDGDFGTRSKKKKKGMSAVVIEKI